MDASPVAGQYDQMIDRESAFEMLQKRAGQSETQANGGGWTLPDFGGNGTRVPGRQPSQPRPSNRQTVTETAVKSVVRSVGSSLGRELVRGILGILKK